MSRHWIIAVAVLPLLTAATPLPTAPRTCLTPSAIRSTRIVGDSAILFQVGNQWYRSDLPQRCIGLNPSRGIKQTIQGNSICAGDPFEIFAPGQGQGIGMTMGNCNYGPFTPVDKPTN